MLRPGVNTSGAGSEKVESNGAPDFDPLWTVLDTTPEGRGKDWYPILSY